MSTFDLYKLQLGSAKTLMKVPDEYDEFQSDESTYLETESYDIFGI